MIVCHCAVATDRDVAGSIAAGSKSLADVCWRTSAGRSAGVCPRSRRCSASIAPGEPRVRGRWRMQPARPRVVELLNEALTFEFPVTNA